MVTELAARGRLIGLRLAGTVLVAANATIHLYLWVDGYRYIDAIGPLFLLNLVSGAVLALALALAPSRFVFLAAVAGALFLAGTLAALLTSLNAEIFGFRESWSAPLVKPTLIVCSVGVLVLGVLAADAARQAGIHPAPPWRRMSPDAHNRR